ncbi:MAG: class I SAM-dependent methyltransferase [Thermoplasmata archaeon]
MSETSGERIRRRGYWFARHPFLWSRFLLLHELGHRELAFGDDPRFRDPTTLYRLARDPLARALGIDARRLDPIAAELRPVTDAMVAELAREPKAGALMQAPLLYVLARAARPRIVVETGVSSGYSARFLLEALERNRAGVLHSIGLPRLAMDPTRADRFRGGSQVADRPIGWLVPDRLKARWKVHVGRSDDLLEPLLGGFSEPMGIFLHDSLHQYATMAFEYRTAWEHLPPGGLLVSHDIHSSRAWPEFLRLHAPLPPDGELDHDLGVVRRPAVETPP